jgi:hypothetical protein
VLPALAGFALIVSLVVAHFWSRGALGPLYWTTFVAPSMAMAELPAATLHRLALSTGWFLMIWLAGLPLIWLGLRKVGNRYAVHLLLAWIGAATLGIAVQRNFWPYHYLLLVMPVGLLVLVGIVETIERLKNINHPIRIAAFVAAPLLLTACVPVASKMLTLYDATQAPGDFIENYYSKISPPYADLRAAAAAISGPHAKAGSTYSAVRISSYMRPASPRSLCAASAASLSSRCTGMRFRRSSQPRGLSTSLSTATA